MNRVTILTVTAKPRHAYEGYDMYLGGAGEPGDAHVKIGHKPYDGSCAEKAEQEVVSALAGMLRERLGWQQDAREELY